MTDRTQPTVNDDTPEQTAERAATVEKIADTIGQAIEDAIRGNTLVLETMSDNMLRMAEDARLDQVREEIAELRRTIGLAVAEEIDRPQVDLAERFGAVEQQVARLADALNGIAEAADKAADKAVSAKRQTPTK